MTVSFQNPPLDTVLTYAHLCHHKYKGYSSCWFCLKETDVQWASHFLQILKSKSSICNSLMVLYRGRIGHGVCHAWWACVCSTTLSQGATWKTFLEKLRLGRVPAVMTVYPISKDGTGTNSTLSVEADGLDFKNKVQAMRVRRIRAWSPHTEGNSGRCRGPISSNSCCVKNWWNKAESLIANSATLLLRLSDINSNT